MTDVFISYKRRLRPRVAQIAEALEALGLNVWYDAGIVPGESFSAEISANLKAAKAVLVCWSPDVFETQEGQTSWVLAEATMGRDRRVLVPVKLEPTLLEPPWNIIHHEDLSTWDPSDPSSDRTAYQQVLVAIGQHVNRPGLAEFDRAFHAAGITPLRKWAQKYPDDPMAKTAWDEIERREGSNAYASRPVPPPPPPQRPARFVSDATVDRPPADVAPPSARESMPAAGAWSRYFARVIDTLIWGIAGIMLLGGVLFVVSTPLYYRTISQNDAVLGIAAVGLGTLINGVIFGLFSTTIGKTIFGIRVFKVGSDKILGFGEAFMREVWVWVRALALGLPVLNIITMALEFRRLQGGEPASYDKGKFVVRQKEITIGRRGFGMVVAITMLLTLVSASLVGANMGNDSTAGIQVWTNPYSGKTAQIDTAWVSTDDTAPDGAKYTMLSNTSLGLQLIVGVETAGMDFAAYTSALAKSLSTDVALETWVEPPDGNLRFSKGTVNGMPLIAYVWKHADNKYWRIILIDVTGKAGEEFPDTEFVDKIAATF